MKRFDLRDCVYLLAFGTLVLLLAGCATGEPPRTITTTETVEVKVPVLVKREAPAALKALLDLEAPVFVSPDDPRATSALTEEGERRLQILLLALFGRIDGWLAWEGAD